MPARVRLELLGRVRVHRGRRTVTRFRTHKTAALLGYLGLGLKTPHAREVLVDLFWPNADPAAGRGSLSASLSSLRAQLDPTGSSAAGSVILATRHDVALNSDMVSVDLGELESLLDTAASAEETDRRQRLEAALRLYHGPLMPAHYDDWVLRERDRLAERVFAALEDLVALSIRAGDATEAVTLARRGVSTDPLRESAHRLLIRALLAQGKEPDARRQLESLRVMLRREFEADPDEETFALFADPDRPLPARPRPASRARKETPTLPSPTEAPAPAPSRLPRPLTSFVGRTNELNDLARTLADPRTRLVTIVGLGGAGKTRLAIEAAQRFDPDRAWWVSLADIDRPDLIGGTIADAMELSGFGAPPLLDAVQEAVGPTPALVVLDNVEHLREEVSRLAVDLLGRSPTLKLLVTSRVPLGLSLERELALSSMPLPATTDELAAISAADAVTLFVHRAEFVSPGFRLSERNAATVTRICAKVSALPLGIELAAARMQVLSPSRLLTRLDKRLDALQTARSDVAKRHRSMDATIAWSVSLLPREVRTFFEKMTTFPGPWDVEAAEAVSGEPLALDHLSLLREYSLLRLRETDRGPQFYILDVVRTHVAERVGPRRRRALEDAYIAHYIERAATLFTTPASEVRFDLVAEVMADDEHYRLTVTLLIDRAERSGPAAIDALKSGLLLASRLAGPWALRGRLDESRRWLSTLLAINKWRVSSRERGMALGRLAETYHFLSDSESAFPLAVEAVGMLRTAGDFRALPSALHWLAELSRIRGDVDGMREALEESGTIFEANQDWQGLANILNSLGAHAITENRLDEAAELYTRSMHIGRDHHHPGNVASALLGQADVARRRERFDDAHELLAHAEAAIRDCGIHLLNLLLSQTRSDTFRDQGNLPAAAACAATMFALARTHGDDNATAWALRQIADAIEPAAHAETLRGAAARFAPAADMITAQQSPAWHAGAALDEGSLAELVASFRNAGQSA